METASSDAIVISIHTSPKGGDDSPAAAVGARLFQSTPPRREVMIPPKPKICSSEFQSTPPRREVSVRLIGRVLGPDISIHTSPKGGDYLPVPARQTAMISIHTSPKGGEPLPYPCPWNTYFNPHLPEGR